MDAKAVIEKLGLEPLPMEGGFFFETYRSTQVIPVSALPEGYSGDRAHSTAIYFLITPDSCSVMHRLISDEIFHFYAGDPVEMLQLHPDGSHSLIIIGNNLEAGHAPQVIAPMGVWQGCRLAPEGKWALMGTTVAPGFDYADYENGDRQKLIAKYPDCVEMITALTR
ncbi:MAG: cupin domain-containing protein [Armatimonadota bacterium]|nr:cupin domain-containing protein [bacterium]